MLILNPNLILLDEIDSGLDIDAIKIIYQVLAMNRKKDSSLIVVTHNPRILSYLEPTHVHILMNGKIIKSGKTEILEELEKMVMIVLSKREIKNFPFQQKKF